MKSNREDSRVAQKWEYALHLYTLRPLGNPNFCRNSRFAFLTSALFTGYLIMQEAIFFDTVEYL